MKIKDVKKLSPPDRFIYWVKERERVRLAKERGDPKPWTDDEILQTYKFCNIRRKDDRVSRWLLENWYGPYKDHPNMLVACSLARQLNNTDALGEVGFPEVWDADKIYAPLKARHERGLGSYSAAYVITGRFGYGKEGRPKQLKIWQTVYLVCQTLYELDLTVNTNSMRKTWEMLHGLKGHSSFIAGQVVADLRFGLSGGWKDKRYWAPAGPGSMRGLIRYAGGKVSYGGKNIRCKMTQEEFERQLIELRARLKCSAGGLQKTMEAIDIQGCLCEFDKYERVLSGDGRPKQKYPGV